MSRQVFEVIVESPDGIIDVALIQSSLSQIMKYTPGFRLHTIAKEIENSGSKTK